MPWTIYRYITLEVLKLLLLAALALVLVISLGAAIKPLADGLLDPALLGKFVLYLSPPMLQFALPFAAAFAAAMLYARMAADHEVTACAAGGMSHFALLFPVLALGLALTLLFYWANNTVVPRYNQRATRVLQKDVLNLMLAELRKGQPMRDPRYKWVVYADGADARDPTPQERRHFLDLGWPEPPYRVIRLEDAALGILGRDRRLEREGTAAAADLYLFREGSATVALAHLREVSYYDAARGDLVYLQQWTPAIRIPGAAQDKPQFLSRAQLEERWWDQEKSDRVRQVKAELARLVAREELTARVERAAREGAAPMVLDGPGEERYEVRAAAARREDGGLVLGAAPGQRLRVDLRLGGQVVRTIEARLARVLIGSDEADPEPEATLELEQAQVFDPRSAGRGTEHGTLRLPAARWPSPLFHPLQRMGLDDLEALAGRPEFAAVEPVRAAAGNLAWAREQVRRDVVSQMNARTAAAVSCLLALLLGAVAGMLARGRPPLVVFFWCFLLVLFAVIVTNTGRGLCAHRDYPVLLGLSLLWGGDLLLLAVVLLGYLRLAKN